jgi:hypothetical protein
MHFFHWDEPLLNWLHLLEPDELPPEGVPAAQLACAPSAMSPDSASASAK